MTGASHFGPGSMAWTLCRERAVGAMAPRAVVLQYAHPAFAEASARYAKDDTEPGARFTRAADALSSMVFGTRDEVRAQARRIGRLHASVGAVDREAYGWVLITLIDAVLRGSELARGPLSAHDTARFLDDARRFGRLFGVPPRELPRSREELEAKIAWKVREELVVGDEVRALWRFVTAPTGPGPGAALRAALLARWVGATLPGPIAAKLGAPTTGAAWVRRSASIAGPPFAALVPSHFRHVDRYRQAVARLSSGGSGVRLARVET